MARTTRPSAVTGVRQPRLWIDLVAAFVAGGAVAVAFPNWGWWPAALVGLGWLGYTAARRRPRRAAALGWVVGTVYLAVTYWWAWVSVGPIPWAALSLAAGAFGALSAWVLSGAVTIPAVARRSGLWVPLWALAWTGGELLRSVWPFGGMPWGAVAFSQSDSPLGRLIWLGGSPLVSLAVAACGGWLVQVVAWLLRRVRRSSSTREPSGRGQLTALVAATAVMLIGVLLPVGKTFDGQEPGTIRLGVVQGNVSGSGLHAFDNKREVLDNHLAGTYAIADEVGSGGVDAVIWPENGTDLSPLHYADAAADIEQAAEAVGAPMLVGTDYYPETGGRLNISLLWEPGSGAGAWYAKRHPAPFAEYIPMRSVARVFSSAVDLVGTDMLPGTDPAPLSVPMARTGETVKIGPVICFEVAFDDSPRLSVQNGAQVLAVQTNNANFGNTAESTQQLAMTRMRAMETGRAAVQASTVGVSGAYLPDGTELVRTGLFESAHFVVDVPTVTGWTPSTRWGADLQVALGALSGLLAVAGIGSIGLRSIRSRASRR